MAESAASLKTPPGLKADVWKHFGFKSYKDKDELDKTNAVCKLCRRDVPYTGNTTNLRNHIARHHGELAKPTSSSQTALEKAFCVKFPSNSTRALSISWANVEPTSPSSVRRSGC